jgi:hypothetical protein
VKVLVQFARVHIHYELKIGEQIVGEIRGMLQLRFEKR